jgi:hypothetical protein
MKEKLLDVEVMFVHDQGITGQIELSGMVEGATKQPPTTRTIDLNESRSTPDRLIMTLVMARMTKTKLQSVTISGGVVTCVAM